MAACSSDFSLEACCRQIERCTQIAFNCLEKDSQKRPDILKIIDKLNETETDINEVIINQYCILLLCEDFVWRSKMKYYFVKIVYI